MTKLIGFNLASLSPTTFSRLLNLMLSQG